MFLKQIEESLQTWVTEYEEYLQNKKERELILKGQQKMEMEGSQKTLLLLRSPEMANGKNKIMKRKIMNNRLKSWKYYPSLDSKTVIKRKRKKKQQLMFESLQGHLSIECVRELEDTIKSAPTSSKAATLWKVMKPLSLTRWISGKTKQQTSLWYLALYNAFSWSRCFVCWT